VPVAEDALPMKYGAKLRWRISRSAALGPTAGGSSPAKPELGQEMASEGEALIEAFKNGQQFYTLTAWKAVPEVNGKSSPVIVKQVLART